MRETIMKWPETVAIVCPSHEAASALGRDIWLYLEDGVATAVIGELLILETSPDQEVQEAIRLSVSNLKRTGQWR